MRLLVAAAAFIAFAAPAGAAVVYVDRDGGGRVDQYAARWASLERAGKHIVIRGACYSSCTMALGHGACVMPNAVLGFHPAYNPTWNGYRINPVGTEMMRRNLPRDVLRIVDARGGLRDKGGWLSPRITIIHGYELPARYRCRG